MEMSDGNVYMWEMGGYKFIRHIGCVLLAETEMKMWIC